MKLVIEVDLDNPEYKGDLKAIAHLLNRTANSVCMQLAFTEEPDKFLKDVYTPGMILQELEHAGSSIVPARCYIDADDFDTGVRMTDVAEHITPDGRRVDGDVPRTKN